MASKQGFRRPTTAAASSAAPASSFPHLSLHPLQSPSTMPPARPAAVTSPNSAASALLALATTTTPATTPAATKPKVLSPTSRQIFLDLSDEDDDRIQEQHLNADQAHTASDSEQEIVEPALVARRRRHPQQPNTQQAAAQGRRRRPAVQPVPAVPLPLPTAVPSQATLAALAFEQQVVATAAALHAAKRIVVVTGAGISVSAGIPDFRSESGLYNLVKLANPGVVVKGQDLFDVSVFRTEPTRRLFYSFMAGLRDACVDAQPTPVHAMLRDLEVRGKLLRCYTQNIDGFEERAGLGLPVPPPPPPPPPADDGSPGRNALGKAIETIDLRSSSPAPPPPTDVKRNPTVVQLHGTLTHVRCVLCAQRYTFSDSVSAVFADGDAPECPACADTAAVRAHAGRRPVATGTLRPDVVLYNEPHAGGDIVADVLAKDVRRRPDVVLVMGTSLKVHGIKSLVRNLAAAAHGGAPAARGARDDRASDWSGSGSGSAASTSDDDLEGAPRPRSRSRGPRVPLTALPSSSPGRASSASGPAARPKVILVNKTALPAKEWAHVFDTCVTGVDADDVVARWTAEWAKLDRKAADARAKRVAAKERRLAGGVEKGQTRLVFPVVKNAGSAPSAMPVKAVDPAGGAAKSVPLSVKARVNAPSSSGNENLPPSARGTVAVASGKGKRVAATPAPVVHLEQPEVVVIGSSSDDGIEIVEHPRTPVRSRLRPRGKTGVVYA